MTTNDDKKGEGPEFALANGVVIDHWKVVAPLGKGAMAEVYEVEDVQLGSRYALKLFTYDRASGTEVKERFFAEGRLLAKFDHPRLVRVYSMGEEPSTGRPYFVMDLVLDPTGKPRTLADAGAEGVDEMQVAEWYEDLRSALEYVHARGVLHRDLKLQNVLVGADGHAVLSDFGVAKIFNKALREEVGLPAEMTLHAARNGRAAVMGSVGYLAPEVEMGVAASRESDWYALGVMIFHLLTGVWCDMRTDVMGDLETFDPVWKDVLPKLLHANPAGRECPSWRELERRHREEEAFRAEQAYDGARGKLRRAKDVKQLFIGLVAVALAMIGVLSWLLMRQIKATALAAERCATFDDVVLVPADTPEEESAESPSLSQLALARVDAWVLLNESFIDLDEGRIKPAMLAQKMMTLARRAENSELDFARGCGGGDYAQVGEDEPLAFLLYHSASNVCSSIGSESGVKSAHGALEKLIKKRRGD